MYKDIMYDHHDMKVIKKYEGYLTLFKQFLIDNNATSYWDHCKGNASDPTCAPYHWVTSKFDWYNSPEGWDFWNNLDDEWAEVFHKYEVQQFNNSTN